MFCVISLLVRTSKKIQPCSGLVEWIHECYTLPSSYSINCKCMQLMALDVPGMLIHTISHAIDQSCCPCGPAVSLMWASQVSDFRTLFTVTLPLILHPMEFLHCMALSSTWKYGSSSTWIRHGYGCQTAITNWALLFIEMGCERPTGLLEAEFSFFSPSLSLSLSRFWIWPQWS